MTANPITREAFGALVATTRTELAEVSDERRAQFFAVPRHGAPRAWLGIPWVRWWISAGDVMALTGLDRGAVEGFRKQAARVREGGGKTTRAGRQIMPPPKMTGRRPDKMTARHWEWMAGEIALWAAADEPYWERREMTGPVREQHGPVLATDRELADAARKAVELHGGGTSRDDVLEVLNKAGLYARVARIGGALIRARYEHVQACKVPGDGAELNTLESLRPGGLVTGSQIARAFGVDQGAVTHAVTRRQLTPARQGPKGPLFDPAKVTVRKDGQRGPVDAGSERAWAPEGELAAAMGHLPGNR